MCIFCPLRVDPVLCPSAPQLHLVGENVDRCSPLPFQQSVVSFLTSPPVGLCHLAFSAGKCVLGVETKRSARVGQGKNTLFSVTQQRGFWGWCNNGRRTLGVGPRQRMDQVTWRRAEAELEIEESKPQGKDENFEQRGAQGYNLECQWRFP